MGVARQPESHGRRRQKAALCDEAAGQGAGPSGTRSGASKSNAPRPLTPACVLNLQRRRRPSAGREKAPITPQKRGEKSKKQQGKTQEARGIP